MSEEQFDVVVAGGGPAGASAAAMLARNGHRVLLLEKERFPRFHVGESLLPATWPLWDELGVTRDIEEAGFIVKQGATFGMFNQPSEIQLLTAEFPDCFQRPYTYQVERAKFDEILLNNARRCGAEVREEWSVQDVLLDGDRAVGVMAGPNGEQAKSIGARVVIDATGRSCLLARTLGLRKPDPALNKIAHFTHFKGPYRRPNNDPVFPDSSMTDIYTIDGGWVWYIPLADERGDRID